MASNKITDEWLTNYYQRLVGEYQFSLTRRDNATNWALTLFLAVVAAYAVILTSSTTVLSFWKIAFLLASLGLLVRFFSQSMIAYSFLRRWRYLENRIESYWSSGKPSLEAIEEDIKTYDHGRRTPVTKRAMIWSQLRAGFLLMFLALSGVLYFEFSQVKDPTVGLYAIFVGFIVYVIWETTIFVTYDQLKKPKATTDSH